MSLLDGAQGRKFVYSGPDDHGMDEHFVVAADLDYWLENFDLVEDWLINTFEWHELGGCVITLKSKEDAAIFLLRWA